MSNGNAQPATRLPAAILPPPDTVLRGVPALKKLPPWTQYLLVMVLTSLGGYIGQGATGVSADEAQAQHRVVLEELTKIKDGVHDLEIRMTRIEAKREVEKRGAGG